MKKLFIISFFVAFCLMSKAQMWCAPGAEWNYAFSFPFPAATGHVKLKYTNDSTINSTVYKKILPTFIPGPPMYGIVQFWPQYFLINESNKVLSLYTANSGIDTLFNFNAAIGDVWLRARWPLSPQCDAIRRAVTVLDTASVTINGIKLKRLVLNYVKGSHVNGPPPPQTSAYIDTVYEKIGSIKNHLIPIVCETQSMVLDVSSSYQHGTLRCYRDNNFPFYQASPGVSCLTIPTELTEKQNLNSQFSIFPNPTNGIINICSGNNNSEDKIHIEMKDISGRLIRIQKFSNENASVDLNKFENGIYFLQIIKDSRTLQTTKVIKE